MINKNNLKWKMVFSVLLGFSGMQMSFADQLSEESSKAYVKALSDYQGPSDGRFQILGLLLNDQVVITDLDETELSLLSEELMRLGKELDLRKEPVI